ncbi:monocyte to macrophage differentiation factor isoform X1 [Antennarius striatus]|uniref:monocyte to macrophage differentiation factor isoform X1 n=1 Tax=Antennarius striatus TaxID=241820 RepID=UPI0035B432F6
MLGLPFGSLTDAGPCLRSAGLCFAACGEMKRVNSLQRFMNRRPAANRRYQPTGYEHAANCYTHAVSVSSAPHRAAGHALTCVCVCVFVCVCVCVRVCVFVCVQLLIAPAFVGMATLHRLADSGWQRLTAWVYGLGLCALFLVSTVFHVVTWKKSHMRSVEQCFHMCDRVVIYFFIAASYTPWLTLRELGPLAAHMRWLVWLMAVAGTLYVVLYHEKYKVVELLFYLSMGFLPAAVLVSMTNTEGLQELAWGGLIYCVGVFFFKCDGVIPFAHAIWHVFVALAAAVHYYAIWRYLYRAPGPAPSRL